MAWWNNSHATYDDPALRSLPPWPLSDGEIHYFFWFIQGSIMNATIRAHLRRAWGFCERHAWGAIAVEMSFRRKFLMGPAVLYEDLMARCLASFPKFRPQKARRFARKLRSSDVCMMCDMKTYQSGIGVAPRDRLEQGRRTDLLREFALEHEPYWREYVCGLCHQDNSEVRCRRHFIEHASSLSEASVERHYAMLRHIYKHLVAFDRSFVWENRGTDGPEDRGALLGAVGWLSGWRPLLALTQPAQGEASA